MRLCGTRESLSCTFASSLKVCARKNLFEVARLHADILSHGLLESYAHLGNLLVSIYAKNGALSKAQQILYELPIRDVISWSSLVSAYAQRGQCKHAVECYKHMRIDGLSPNAVTFTCVLKACGRTQDIHLGKQVHLEILNKGLLKDDIILSTALVDMYSKCDLLANAQQVLADICVRDVVSWSALIAGYAQKGLGKETLDCYDEMLRDGFSPNAITYACVLKACGITQDITRGMDIHDEIVRQNLLHKDCVLGTALVDMYVKCGALKKAREVFNELPVRTVVSWSGLIGGYTQQGKGKEALHCFEEMQNEGISPNAVTYTSALKACGMLREILKGKEIHEEILRQGLLQSHAILGTSLVDMYAKCGLLRQSRELLEGLPIQNVGSWNALIAEHAERGEGVEALALLKQMEKRGVSPDAITYLCILNVCSFTEAFQKGEKTHCQVFQQGLVAENVVLGSALVDMYVKWGALATAKRVFEELPVQCEGSWNTLIAGLAQQGEGAEAAKYFVRMRREGFTSSTVSWNALLGGYAIQGFAKKVVATFSQMQQEGFSPDSITFVHVLSTCSHTGLVDEGQMYFKMMWDIFGIKPDFQHLVCMIDLFGRAGHLGMALALMQQMPSLDLLPVWSSFLGACQKWGNVTFGRLAFDCAIQLDKYAISTYISMENIYAAVGLHNDARQIEARRLKLTQ